MPLASMMRPSWSIRKLETPIDRARPYALSSVSAFQVCFYIPVLVGKRVVDQVQVDVVVPESLKALLEQAQRRIPAMLRELRRNENARALRAAAPERLPDTGLGAVHGRSVDQAIASLEPVKHILDRVSRRYTKAKAELRYTVPIIQHYVGDGRRGLVKSHGHDPSGGPLSVKLS
jgi:hypothetical protein